MIAKKIHYCWFWRWNKSDLIEKCILSWKKFLPDYEIIEWNEDNFDINQNEFIKKAYKEKKWAFVADFARFKILYDNWWIYLDTDMEVLNSLDFFLDKKLFLWFEDEKYVNWSIIWAIKWNYFIKSCLENYNYLDHYKLIPIVITEELEKLWTLLPNSNQIINDIHIYSSDFFYPLPFWKKINSNMITENSHTIHHREASWFPWYFKLAKKMRLLKVTAYIWKIKNKVLDIF